jgi:TRAP-type C4-dicarboxylate transport system permease small subunit
MLIALKVLAAAALVAIALIMQLQVFQRYVLNYSLSWPDELAGILLAVLTFVGGAIAARHDEHISVTVLLDRMSEGWRLVVRSLADLVMLLFIGVVALYSVPLVIRTWNQTPITVPVSRGLIYLVIWIGIAAMFWYALMRSALVRYVRDRCLARTASQEVREESR